MENLQTQTIHYSGTLKELFSKNYLKNYYFESILFILEKKTILYYYVKESMNYWFLIPNNEVIEIKVDALKIEMTNKLYYLTCYRRLYSLKIKPYVFFKPKFIKFEPSFDDCFLVSDNTIDLYEQIKEYKKNVLEEMCKVLYKPELEGEINEELEKCKLELDESLYNLRVRRVTNEKNYSYPQHIASDYLKKKSGEIFDELED